MMAVLLVAVGGGFGAGVRWITTELVQPTAGFPVAITIVNVVGSLALGVVVGADVAASLAVDIAPFTVGILAGFTTFSTWMVDIDTAETPTSSLLIAVVPLIVGLGAASAGIALGTAIG